MCFELTDAMLPATLNCQPMTDHEFVEFCQEHPDLFFEMSAEGELIVMAPTNSDTGVQSMLIAQQLGTWALQDDRGFACDSSTGYVLPNGARRSPDASWILKDRVNQLESGREDSFWHLCPDFVVELRSRHDRINNLRQKMLEYAANGAQLGWLIDPTDHSVTIYRPNAEPEIRTDINVIQGEGPVAAFTLKLNLVWNPLG